MSQPLWSKTTLAQAVGLTVAGTGVSAAMADGTPNLRITHFDSKFEFQHLTQAMYASDHTGDADASGMGRIDLTIPVKPEWDVRVSVRDSDADGKVDGFTYSPIPPVTLFTRSSLSMDIQMIDFEAGHHVKLGQQDVRVFGGLRYTDLDSEAKSIFGESIYGKYVSIGASRKSDLEAYGVRAGAETSIPLTKAISATGLAAMSVTQGTRDNEGVTHYFNSHYSYSLDDDDVTTVGYELGIGLTWDPSPETESGPLFSLGYFWNETKDILTTSVFSNDSDDSDLTETGFTLSLDFPL